jgi:FimV-like protein
MAQPTSRSSQSIESLKRKMARDPFSRAFLQLAEEYRRAGRFEEAVQVCQEGLARHPTYHTARIALGRTYLEAGDLETARRTLGEVIELAPENHLAAKLLAEVQRRLGDSAGAAETYRSILRHYPGDREVEALLRDLLDAAGPSGGGPGGEPPIDYRPEDLGVAPPVPVPVAGPVLLPLPGSVPVATAAPAPASIDGSADTGGTDALQTNTLAELYLRQGLVDRAIEVYRSMLQVDPANERARRRLAELADAAVIHAPVVQAAPPPVAQVAPRPVEPVVPAVPVPAAPVRIAPGHGLEQSSFEVPAPRSGRAGETAAAARPASQPVKPPPPPPPPVVPDPRHASARRLRQWLQRVQGRRGMSREVGRS